MNGVKKVVSEDLSANGMKWEGDRQIVREIQGGGKDNYCLLEKN